MKVTKADRDQAIQKLREWFPTGTNVHTVLRRVSRSGMSRSISIIAATTKDGQYIENFDFWASRALGWRIDSKQGGVKVAGCGMDMGFHLVYSLAQVIHGDGYALNHRWV